MALALSTSLREEQVRQMNTRSSDVRHSTQCDTRKSLKSESKKLLQSEVGKRNSTQPNTTNVDAFKLLLSPKVILSPRKGKRGKKQKKYLQISKENNHDKPY